MNLKIRLIVMNFLEFAVWGAYLTSMGRYLSQVGMGSHIGWFYSVQGFASLCMPALMGIVADRWMEAQRVYGLCHFLAGSLMLAVSMYGLSAGADVSFPLLFTLYTLSIAFYMPTVALANSVAYSALDKARLDAVKVFPSIRVFGTIGFICTMILIDLIGFQAGPKQFAVSGVLGLLLAAYSFTLPRCAVNRKANTNSLVDALGLRAFSLFKEKKMAVFFIFSMLLGVSLQITNGYANPFIATFAEIPFYKETFGVQHANILISISQMSETCFILLIPFCLNRFVIKRVMLMAMLAWVLRFGLFGAGNPGDGVWMFILSMIVYGIAFDFFNISGSLFVDRETNPEIRSSAQGVFMMMTNGLGASIGMLTAQTVVNRTVYSQIADPAAQLAGWQTAWYIFAGYALAVTILFAIFFRYKHEPVKNSEHGKFNPTAER